MFDLGSFGCLAVWPCGEISCDLVRFTAALTFVDDPTLKVLTHSAAVDMNGVGDGDVEWCRVNCGLYSRVVVLVVGWDGGVGEWTSVRRASRIVILYNPSSPSIFPTMVGLLHG